MLRKLVYGLGMFISIASHSQGSFVAGFVVRNEGDTLSGFINYGSWVRNPAVIDFRQTDTSNSVTFSPGDIKGFHVGNEVYVSGTVEVENSSLSDNDLDENSQPDLTTESVFLRSLITGEKGLYEFVNDLKRRNFYILENDQFELLRYKKYIRVLNGQRMIAESNKYLGRLHLYLGDCETIESRLSSTSYNARALLDLFHYYYKCTNAEPVFERKKRKVLTEAGLYGGVSVTSLALTELGANQHGGQHNDITDPDYDISVNPAVGAYFDIVFPSGKSYLILGNELAYSGYAISNYSENYESTGIYSTRTIHIGYSYIKINTLLRIKRPIGSVQPFFDVGISNGWAIKETNSKFEVEHIYSVARVNDLPAIAFVDKHEAGYILGVGAQYKKLAFEMRYETGNGMSKVVTLQSSTKRYFFLLKYRFSK